MNDQINKFIKTYKLEDTDLKYFPLSLFIKRQALYVIFKNKKNLIDHQQQMEESLVVRTSLVRENNQKGQKRFNKQVLRSSFRQSQDSHKQSRSEQIKENQGQVKDQSHIKIQQQKGSPEQDNKLSFEQRLKMRKYDYLNKYNQHELLTQSYQNCLLQQDNQKQNLCMNLQLKLLEEKNDIRRNRFQRFVSRQRRIDKKPVCSSLQLKNKYNTSLAHDKNPIKQQFMNSRSKSRSPSSNQSKKQLFKPLQPHFKYLQAYKNNISQDPYNSVTNSNYNSQNNYSSNNASPKRPVMNVFSINQTFADEQKSLNSTKKSLKQAMTRIPNLTNGLTVEISHQNQLYRGQVNQYRRLVAKLQLDLINKKQQLIVSKQSMMNQKLCYQQIIQKLRDEINILAGYRQRYEILNKQMQQLHRKNFELSQEKNKIICINQISEDNKKQMQRKNHQISRQITKNIQNVILNRFELIFDQSASKRTKNNESSHVYEISKSIQQIAQRIEKIIQKNKKYQDLLYSIEQMYRKIQKVNKNNHQLNGNSNPTIKQLWKWLKYMGSVYSFVLEIKPLICNKVGMDEKQSHNLEIKNILEILLINT